MWAVFDGDDLDDGALLGADVDGRDLNGLLGLLVDDDNGLAARGVADGALLGADVDEGLFDLGLDDPLRACGALAHARNTTPGQRSYAR